MNPLCFIRVVGALLQAFDFIILKQIKFCSSHTMQMKVSKPLHHIIHFELLMALLDGK